MIYAFRTLELVAVVAAVAARDGVELRDVENPTLSIPASRERMSMTGTFSNGGASLRQPRTRHEKSDNSAAPG